MYIACLMHMFSRIIYCTQNACSHVKRNKIWVWIVHLMFWNKLQQLKYGRKVWNSRMLTLIIHFNTGF